MLITLGLYALPIWLVFFRFKWLPFNWTFSTLATLVGVAIALVFVGLLNALTPSGKIEVVGKVVEVTPNVSGQVTALPVERNVVIKRERRCWHTTCTQNPLRLLLRFGARIPALGALRQPAPSRLNVRHDPLPSAVEAGRVGLD